MEMIAAETAKVKAELEASKKEEDPMKPKSHFAFFQFFSYILFDVPINLIFYGNRTVDFLLLLLSWMLMQLGGAIGGPLACHVAGKKDLRTFRFGTPRDVRSEISEIFGWDSRYIRSDMPMCRTG